MVASRDPVGGGPVSVGGRGVLDVYHFKDRSVSFGGREVDVGE